MSPIPGMLAGGELPGMESLDLNSEIVGNQLNTILSSFKTDSSLKFFLSEDFDAVKHVGNAIGNGTVSRSLQETENAANLVSAQVREEVIRRQDALLGEVEAVSALEQQIESLSNGLNKLAATTDQLVDSLNDPFEKIQKSIHKMKNAALAADLLQKVVRFQTCSNKVQAFCSSNDSTDADGLKSTAEAVRELEELIKTPPLDRVDIVARELPAIRKANSEYKSRVTDTLRNAMASGDPLLIAAALQSIDLLGNIEERLDVEVKNLVAQAQKAIIEGFDTKQVVQKTAQSTHADIALPEMWKRLDGAIEQLHDVIVQIIKLQVWIPRFSAQIDANGVPLEAVTCSPSLFASSSLCCNGNRTLLSQVLSTTQQNSMFVGPFSSCSRRISWSTFNPYIGPSLSLLEAYFSTRSVTTIRGCPRFLGAYLID